jgi:hypothetical protein
MHALAGMSAVVLLYLWSRALPEVELVRNYTPTLRQLWRGCGYERKGRWRALPFLHITDCHMPFACNDEPCDTCALQHTRANKVLTMRVYVCFLLFHPALGVSYSSLNVSEALCEGIVSFDVKSTTPTTTLEASVQTEINLVPLWAEKDCRMAVRSIACMNAYVPYSTAGLTFCSSDCTSLLTACTSLQALLKAYSPSTESLFSSILCSTKDASASVCAGVGTATTIAQDEPLCPEPALAVPDAVSLASTDNSNAALVYVTGH